MSRKIKNGKNEWKDKVEMGKCIIYNVHNLINCFFYCSLASETNWEVNFQGGFVCTLVSGHGIRRKSSN